MNPIEQLISSGYLIIHQEDARERLSPGSYRELITAMEESLKKRRGTPLSKEESHAMEAYFSTRIDSLSQSCPSCGSTVVHQGGCVQCSNPTCGWAACG